MKDEEIAKEIIALKNADLEFREKLIKKGQLGGEYNREMAILHNRNAQIIEKIIDNIGYPAAHKVGKEASEAAWLVIQHAIGQPKFMKKCAGLLKSTVDENKADARNLAFLTDRIAVLEGNPQLFGTQFDWDENGQMSPNIFDDRIKVNQRRKSIGLNTLEAQTEIMRQRIKAENQLPPKNFGIYKQAFDEWRKAVGWIV